MKDQTHDFKPDFKPTETPVAPKNDSVENRFDLDSKTVLEVPPLGDVYIP